MTEVASGTLVEIEKIILTPEERAPQVPEDTKKIPYILRVSGLLEKSSKIGENATITTLAGRKFTGKLITVNPSYSHSFGKTVKELVLIGKEDLL